MNNFNGNVEDSNILHLKSYNYKDRLKVWEIFSWGSYNIFQYEKYPAANTAVKEKHQWCSYLEKKIT